MDVNRKKITNVSAWHSYTSDIHRKLSSQQYSPLIRSNALFIFPFLELSVDTKIVILKCGEIVSHVSVSKLLPQMIYLYSK